jgi:hypothetical protein
MRLPYAKKFEFSLVKFVVLCVFLAPSIANARSVKKTYSQDYYRDTEIAFFRKHAQTWLDSVQKPADLKKSTATIDLLLGKRDRFHFDSELTDIALDQYFSRKQYNTGLLATLITNKLHGLAKKVIREKPSLVTPFHLELLLKVIQDQSFVPQSSIELATAIYQQQLSRTTLKPQMLVRLATLAYKQKQPTLSLAILNKIEKPSKRISARKTYLAALISLKSKDPALALKQLKPLCTTKSDPETMDAACLSYAKILASTDDFKNSKEFFEMVGADSSLYSDALFDLLWTKWRDQTYSEAIELAQQWGRLFPNHGLSFEVDRLQALSLLQSKSYKQSIFTYRNIQHRLLFEKNSVRELAVYTFNHSFDFIRQFSRHAIVLPITDRAKGMLLSTATFKNLLYLDQEIETIEQSLTKMSQRINRIDVYLKNFQPVDPFQANRLDRGLVIMKQLRRARQSLLPLGYQKRPNIITDKLVELDNSIDDTERRIEDIFEHLEMRPAYVFGLKRKSFSDLIARASIIKKHSYQHKQKLTATKSHLEGILIGTERQSLYNAAHSLPAKISPLTTTTSADLTIDSINSKLKTLSKPKILNEQSLRNQLQNLNQSSKYLTRDLEKLRNTFANASSQYFTKFLKGYERDLNELGRDLNWGLINAEHAYLSVLNQNRREKTQIKYSVMQNFDTLTKNVIDQ